MTKPLQGKLFEKFRKLIMGHDVSSRERDDRSVLEGDIDRKSPTGYKSQKYRG